jgi:putative acetyltransferase
MSPVTIRRERADHPQVVALLQALDRYLADLYEPEANHIMSVGELLAPDVRFFAAWQGDRIVGTGAVRVRAGEHDDEAPYGEVKRMYVDPSVRGQRIGERLLSTLEGTLRDEGVGLAMLETGRDQHAAVRLYERCGFAQCAAFGGYPENGLSLFMEKHLRKVGDRQERAA